ncbi:MAG: hypothetical protein IJ400_02820 [Clostridia bacterium]|nr:hypothetical protein [Clostridia bacterium]
MKKLALVIALFLLFLVGCQEQSYGILPYQENDLEAVCVINEKYTARLTKQGEKRSLTILEPESLCGIEIYYENESAFLVAEETKIPVKKESLCGIVALLSAFSLNEEHLVSATGTEVATLEFQTEECYYTLTLGKNKMPKAITIQGKGFSYNVIVKEIKLA